MLDIAIYKKALKDKRLTYANLSELTGIPIGTIKRLLSGVTANPRIETIKRIEEVLGFSSVEIVMPYLTEQEEDLLRTFKSLSQESKKIILAISKRFVFLESNYEN